MKDRYIQLIGLGIFILWVIFRVAYQGKLAIECPNEYYRTKIYPKLYKARLIKKNKQDGEGVSKPGIPSVDLDNQGEILHIGMSPNVFLDVLFDKRFWEYVEEGDSIIKAKNSYQLKVVRGSTVKIFEIDCEAYKRELENK